MEACQPPGFVAVVVEEAKRCCLRVTSGGRETVDRLNPFLMQNTRRSRRVA
jgi:hypothetical protein